MPAASSSRALNGEVDEQLAVGDARHLNQLLSAGLLRQDQSIRSIITSPPYWRLKNYGADDQIGWSQTYEEYLADCTRVFGDLFERATEDATMWIISDSFIDQRSSPRRLIQLPSDLARCAEASGWTLRDVYIWRKDKTLPYSGPGRLRNGFEYIYFFVKSNDFLFAVDRVRDPVNLSHWWVQYPERYHPMGKVPTNVWDIPIPVQGTWGSRAVQHACPLPPDLVERIVLLSTEPGDIVFDPFAGTGTVPAEAARLGRIGRGVELNAEYVEAYKSQIRDLVLSRFVDPGSDREAGSLNLAQTIRRLRVVKYAKVLGQAYRKTYQEERCFKFAAAYLVDEGLLSVNPKANIVFVIEEWEDPSLIKDRLFKLTFERPMSRFQVEVKLEVVRLAAFLKRPGVRNLAVYEHGRTWRAEGTVGSMDLSSLKESAKVGKYFPILSNVFLSEVAHREYA